jgi:hypothetical protein
MALDVVIAIKDRDTVLRCVSTLIAQMQLAKIALGQILLCDGGSRTFECKRQLQQVAQLTPVKILSRPHAGFNKGWLLNQGIQTATAPVVLISDIDILWQADTLENITTAAAAHPHHFYCVKSVQESEINAVAMRQFPWKASQRDASRTPSRYSYRLSQTPSETTVSIYAAKAEALRPGCGLVCAQRDLFWQVGGYRHCFWGWGWEDQDLLMRAQLLRYSVAELGVVTHLSHGDAVRNAFDYADNRPDNLLNKPSTLPAQSRDRNILICLKGLAQGNLIGDLPDANRLNTGSSGPIRVQYPPQLAYAAHPDYALPQSPQSPD